MKTLAVWLIILICAAKASHQLCSVSGAARLAPSVRAHGTKWLPAPPARALTARHAARPRAPSSLDVGQRGPSLGTGRALSSFPATPPAVRPECFIGVLGRRWFLAEGPPTEGMRVSDQAPGLRLVALGSRFVTSHPKSGAGQPPTRIRSGLCERAGLVEVARRPPAPQVGWAGPPPLRWLDRGMAWASLPLPSLWVQGPPPSSRGTLCSRTAASRGCTETRGTRRTQAQGPGSGGRVTRRTPSSLPAAKPHAEVLTLSSSGPERHWK